MACSWVDFWAKAKVTPLMVAAYYKQAECVRILLEHGADLLACMQPGGAIPMPADSNALHCCARVADVACACEILKAQVHPHFRLQFCNTRTMQGECT